MVVLKPVLEGEHFKCCSRCPHIGIASPLLQRTSFYGYGRDERGIPKGYHAHCRWCDRRMSSAYQKSHRERTNETARERHNRRMAADPEYRERVRLTSQRYREAAKEDPERAERIRKSRRKYEQNRQRNMTPEQRRHINECKRLRYRLDRERAGHKLPDPQLRASAKGVTLPIGPFRDWIEALIAKADREHDHPNDSPVEIVAAWLDVSDRRLYGYRYELDKVPFDVVDRACTREGSIHVHELYPEAA